MSCKEHAMKKLYSLLLILALLTGCAPKEPVVTTVSPTLSPTKATADRFSDRDLNPDYSENKSTRITLSGSSAHCDSDAVRIDGSTVTVTDEGTYILQGELEGTVTVNADKQDKVQLVLEGAAIHSPTCAALYILQADKVFLTLAEGTENTLSNGGSFEPIDENSIDAALFSKEDLTLNGNGSLKIESPAGHGIVSKDSLTVTGGSFQITCAGHGLSGKDDVTVADGSFTIASGKDGIQAENEEDAALGFVYIENGSFAITAEGDGISASAYLTVAGGSFDITTGGGSVNGTQQTSQNWGGFGGGRGMGGPGREFGGMGSQTQPETEDSTSIKGLKAQTLLTVSGGSLRLNCADDALHSDGDLTVIGGSFAIATGDDGIHAEENLTVSGGTVAITESYEGLEALHITVSGGEISMVCSDNGLNAAGGTDQSGFGGRDPFGRPGMGGGMSGNSDGTILISGGSLAIRASGDGIDANGSLEITGGFTTVCGPTQGDTATLDYDLSATISGGTFVGTGAQGMAQTFSGGEQGVISLSVGSMAAGTAIVLTDEAGTELLRHTPELSYNVLILSCPEMVKGGRYTVTIGTASGTFEAS